MVKRLFHTFVSTLFLVLVILQIVRFFTLSQDISNVNYSDTFFSSDKTTYFLSSHSIIELIQYAPSFSLTDLKELFVGIFGLFKSIDSFLDVVYVFLFFPIIISLPLLFVLDYLINIVIYVISVLIYVCTYQSSFSVDYLNITQTVSNFIKDVIDMA